MGTLQEHMGNDDKFSHMQCIYICGFNFLLFPGCLGKSVYSCHNLITIILVWIFFNQIEHFHSLLCSRTKQMKTHVDSHKQPFCTFITEYIKVPLHYNNFMGVDCVKCGVPLMSIQGLFLYIHYSLIIGYCHRFADHT